MYCVIDVVYNIFVCSIPAVPVALYGGTLPDLEGDCQDGPARQGSYSTGRFHVHNIPHHYQTLREIAKMDQLDKVHILQV